jgi:hypothetical protein
MRSGVSGISAKRTPKGDSASEHTAYFTPPQASYCNGTHVAEVEVDPMTAHRPVLVDAWRARRDPADEPACQR